MEESVGIWLVVSSQIQQMLHVLGSTMRVDEAQFVLASRAQLGVIIGCKHVTLKVCEMDGVRTGLTHPLPRIDVVSDECRPYWSSVGGQR